MKRRLIRWGLYTLALGVAGFIVAASGIIPIKASSGHWRITEWFLHFSMRRSIATHSLGIEAPPDLDDPRRVQIGAAHYDLGCRSCHGEPQRARPRIASSMLPTPPDLAPRVREGTAEELFHVVKHGMKFTGMPAWPSQQRDDEAWAMIAFLLRYPGLDTASYRQLAGREEIAQAHAAGTVPLSVAQSCVRCHGIDGHGRGNSLMPSLAGQRYAYLRKALEAYASDRRHSGTMGAVALELTPDVMDEVANYYATLPSERDQGVDDEKVIAFDAASLARGESIAREGIRAERVPACLECHGSAARRGKPEYPQLAGQHADYLEQQLLLFRENRRGGSDHAHLMQPIAARLTAAQARDVARYFASLPPEAADDAGPER